MNQAFIFLTGFFFRLLPTTQLRAWYLRRRGASIGRNCRIHTVEFLNLDRGFARLVIGSNCYIGPGVLIDLAGTVDVGEGTAISARAILLSHDDPGSSHGSPLCAIYPPQAKTTRIGRFSWIGAGSIVLSGSTVGDECVLAAGSVARGKLEASCLYAGHPATLKKRLS